MKTSESYGPFLILAVSLSPTRSASPIQFHALRSRFYGVIPAGPEISSPDPSGFGPFRNRAKKIRRC
jgi:hypothetical protein